MELVTERDMVCLRRPIAHKLDVIKHAIHHILRRHPIRAIAAEWCIIDILGIGSDGNGCGARIRADCDAVHSDGASTAVLTVRCHAVSVGVSPRSILVVIIDHDSSQERRSELVCDERSILHDIQHDIRQKCVAVVADRVRKHVHMFDTLVVHVVDDQFCRACAVRDDVLRVIVQRGVVGKVLVTCIEDPHFAVVRIDLHRLRILQCRAVVELLHVPRRKWLQQCLPVHHDHLVQRRWYTDAPSRHCDKDAVFVKLDAGDDVVRHHVEARLLRFRFAHRYRRIPVKIYCDPFVRGADHW
mmetsp:Transcript_45169/g.72167  ORF Transcript_45169/g.72167 Transcript_45169/m.72167 type:complete len:299 (+) Transcript_45169:140-1036(+)